MHLDYIFPKCIGFNSEGGVEYLTAVHEADNGARQVFFPWPVGRCRYNAQSGLKTLNDYETVYKLFRACKGTGNSFDWFDWNDHKSSDLDTDTTHTDMPLGTGDAIETRFKLYKQYIIAGETESRRIFRPDLATLELGLNGSLVNPAGWSWDSVTYEVVFDSPPAGGAVLTWGGDFYTPVAFTTNYLPANISNKNASGTFYCGYPIELQEVSLE